MTTRLGELTNGQRFLLEWLGKAEFSQYGECHGHALEALVGYGLAVIHEGRENQSGFIAQGGSPMHRAVSLTEAGRALRKEMEST
jgi:hypothetical protein